MKLQEILKKENTHHNAQADSAKAVLELISKSLAQHLLGFEYDTILDCLLKREKIGSTGIGHGIAIPHARIDNIQKPIAALIHLQKPINFAALDNQPTDIFFALLVPAENADDYLDILAEIAKKFRSKALREKLRAAKNDSALHQCITEND